MVADRYAYALPVYQQKKLRETKIRWIEAFTIFPSAFIGSITLGHWLLG